MLIQLAELFQSGVNLVKLNVRTGAPRKKVDSGVAFCDLVNISSQNSYHMLLYSSRKDQRNVWE